MPWYYYGVHTDNGKPYLGSPRTNKWIWDMYDAEIQILERFEDRKEAEKVERRLIKHFVRDINCLNCQVGGQPTNEQRLKGVNRQLKEKIGIFRSDKPWEKERAKKATETMRSNGTGLFDTEVKRKGGKKIGQRHKETGHIQALGRAQGKRNVENGTLNPSKGAAAQHSWLWKCLETGYISTACGLSHYQRSRGISVSKRVKIEKRET
jgi:hypothetical protein